MSEQEAYQPGVYVCAVCSICRGTYVHDLWPEETSATEILGQWGFAVTSSGAGGALLTVCAACLKGRQDDDGPWNEDSAAPPPDEPDHASLRDEQLARLFDGTRRTEEVGA